MSDGGDYSDFAVAPSTVQSEDATAPDYSDFAVAPSQASRAARGVRNNNPVNVTTLPKGQWTGQSGSDGDFATFTTPEAGLAAADQNLLNYASKDGVKTVRAAINRWTGNTATPEYINGVSQALGLKPDDPADFSNPAVRHTMLTAMQPYEIGRVVATTPEPAASAEPGMSDAEAQAAFNAAHPGFGTAPASTPITHIEWNAKTNRYEDASGTPYERTGAASVAGPGGAQFDIVTNAPAAAGQVPIRPATPGLDSGTTDAARAAFVPGLVQGAENVGSTFKNLDQFVEQNVPGARAFNQFLDGPGYENVDQKVQELHANRLMNDARYAGNPAYDAGKVTGTVAATAPFMAEGGALLPELGAGGNLFARGAGLAGRGAIEGGAAGALASGGNDRSLAQNVGTGALAGAALGPVIPAVSGAVRNMFTGDISPAVADLANTAVNKYGLPLRTGQIRGAAGDRAAAIQDSNDLSRLGTGFPANNANQWQAFSKAVTGTFGDDSGVLSPSNMSAARTKIGGVMNDVGGRNQIIDADGVMDKIRGIVSDAEQTLPESDVVPLRKQMAAISSKIDGAGTISGQAYQSLTRTGTPLDVATGSSNTNIGFWSRKIKDALDDGMNTSMSPEDQAAFENARWQYKNLMTIKDLAKKANVEGQISPQLLAGAVNKSFKNRAFSGAGDLGELSQIAQTFMKEAPNSQTAARLADMIKAWGVAGLAGGGAGELFLHNPTQAIGAGLGTAAIGGAKLGIDAARGALARSPAMRNMLLNGVQPGPVGNAFLRGAGALARPTLVPVGAMQSQNLFAGQYRPQTALPIPPVLNPPAPPQR